MFAKFHKCRDLYNPQHSVVKWIYTICNSELKDYYRKSTKSVQVTTGIDCDSFLMNGQTASRIDQYISNDQLSQSEREALRLRYGEDKEFLEISQILKTNEPNTRKIVSRALKKLKSIYGRSS